MICADDIKLQRYLPARFAAGLAISTFLALGALVPSVSAQERGDHQNWSERGNQQGWDHRGGWRHDDWEQRHYHRVPPVVYGSPYYYPPPVFYGPTFGLNLPGLSVHVR